MDYRQIASQIIRYVGGNENIKEVTHCFTRLRFLLRDEGKANKQALEKTEGVISVVSANGEYQVVCGAKVDKIYDAIAEQLSPVKQTGDTILTERKEPIGKTIMQTLTKMFTPLVPAIAAAGLIKGLLTAAKLLAAKQGIDISTSDTYTILYNASQVIFYFFPIFLALTTAKAVKCNEIIAMVIGGFLCYPAIDAMIQDVGTATTIFGLPVIKGAWKMGESVKVFSYTESVIPIILAVLVMAYLERLLKKIIPEVVQLILVPGLELIIMLPVTLCILGPVGIYIGNGIAFVYDYVIGISPVLGGALIGGLWGVFVIFGAHRALIPIGLNDVALNGHQNILAFAGSANFAQGGAALGVLLKTKNKGLKQVAASGTIAAALVGVTEPAIYGCNLRLKKPMICAIISGAIGGAIMGIGNVYGDAFANNGVLTIFTYAAFGMRKFIFYLIGIGVAFFLAAFLTYVVGFEDDEADEAEEITGNNILSPIKGEAVALENVKDEAFASGALGKGVAILPEEGIVVAPEDCEISAFYDTHHAICLTLSSGIELLIHVGVNTVKLNGKYFEPLVEQGMQVAKGTPLLRFDINKIKEAGYDVTTPVIVLNSDEFATIAEVTGPADNERTILVIEKENENGTGA